MKNTLIKSKSRGSRQSNAHAAVATVKVIVFEIGSINMALHITNIYKVLDRTSIYGKGLNGVGIAHVGDREVTVVDLHRRLFQSCLLDDASKNGYLMIVKNSQDELYGIPVAAVPTLMEVPISNIRVLPESYRHADTFGFATHVAVISELEPPMTIFLLDIEHLLSVR
jgi:purine-binding chemotaxis protein CheW